LERLSKLINEYLKKLSQNFHGLLFRLTVYFRWLIIGCWRDFDTKLWSVRRQACRCNWLDLVSAARQQSDTSKSRHPRYRCWWSAMEWLQKVKGYSFLWETHLRVTEGHLLLYMESHRQTRPETLTNATIVDHC